MQIPFLSAVLASLLLHGALLSWGYAVADELDDDPLKEEELEEVLARLRPTNLVDERWPTVTVRWHPEEVAEVAPVPEPEPVPEPVPEPAPEPPPAPAPAPEPPADAVMLVESASPRPKPRPAKAPGRRKDSPGRVEPKLLSALGSSDNVAVLGVLRSDRENELGSLFAEGGIAGGRVGGPDGAGFGALRGSDRIGGIGVIGGKLAEREPDKETLERRYFRQVKQYVTRAFTYPEEARARGLEGRVEIELVVDERGRVQSVKMLKSSGHRLLDEHALAVAEDLKIIPRPPEALGWRRRAVHVPFVYRLPK